MNTYKGRNNMKSYTIKTKKYVYHYATSGFIAIENLQGEELFVTQNFYNDFLDSYEQKMDISNEYEIINYFELIGLL